MIYKLDKINLSLLQALIQLFQKVIKAKISEIVNKREKFQLL